MHSGKKLHSLSGAVDSMGDLPEKKMLWQFTEKYPCQGQSKYMYFTSVWEAAVQSSEKTDTVQSAESSTLWIEPLFSLAYLQVWFFRQTRTYWKGLQPKYQSKLCNLFLYEPTSSEMRGEDFVAACQ